MVLAILQAPGSERGNRRLGKPSINPYTGNGLNASRSSSMPSVLSLIHPQSTIDLSGQFFFVQ
jgi:hypothetical protein